MPKAKRKKPGTARALVPAASIERRIYLIRDQKVMLDSDLAQLYQVPTKRLNEAVKRHSGRFPEDFMFQLTEEESGHLRSQSATSKEVRGGRRYRESVFTEQGVAMLSSVLTTVRAIQVNIGIMRAFVKAREVFASNRELAREIEDIRRTTKEHGTHIERLFTIVEQLMLPEVPAKRRIGFPG